MAVVSAVINLIVGIGKSFIKLSTVRKWQVISAVLLALLFCQRWYYKSNPTVVRQVIERVNEVIPPSDASHSAPPQVITRVVTKIDTVEVVKYIERPDSIVVSGVEAGDGSLTIEVLEGSRARTIKMDIPLRGKVKVYPSDVGVTATIPCFKLGGDIALAINSSVNPQVNVGFFYVNRLWKISDVRLFVPLTFSRRGFEGVGIGVEKRLFPRFSNLAIGLQYEVSARDISRRSLKVELSAEIARL